MGPRDGLETRLQHRSKVSQIYDWKKARTGHGEGSGGQDVSGVVEVTCSEQRS